MSSIKKKSSSSSSVAVKAVTEERILHVPVEGIRSKKQVKAGVIPKKDNKRKRTFDGEDDDDDDDDEIGLLENAEDEVEDFDPRELEAVADLVRKNRSGESEEKVGPAAKKIKTSYVNNKALLEEKLRDIALPVEWPWIETLTITSQKPLALEGDDVHDDLKREAAFYEFSLAAVTAGLARLDDLDIPYRIPSDFFAERVKPDAHMNRIKDKLIEEKKRMEAVQERKKQKEMQKFAKQVQSSKIQEKHKEKRQNMEEAARMRKFGASAGGLDDGPEIARSLIPGINDVLKENRNKKGHFNKNELPKKSKKREAKDEKFGFGGKKKYVKSNDKESSSKMSGWNLDKNRSLPKGFSKNKPGSRAPSHKSGGAGGSFSKKRPGKQSRSRK